MSTPNEVKRRGLGLFIKFGTHFFLHDFF